MLIECPSCASRYVIDAAKIGAEGRNVRCASCQKEWFVTQADAIEPEPQPASSPAAPQVASPKANVRGAPEAGETPGGEPDRAAREDDGAPSTEGAPAGAPGTSPPQSAAPRKQNNIDSLFEDNPDAPDTSGHSWDKKEEAQEEEPPRPAPKRPRPAPVRKPSAAAVFRARASAATRSPLAVGLVGVALLAGLIWQRERVVFAAPSAAGVYAAIGMPVNLARLEFGEVRSSLVRDGQARFLVVEAVVRNPLPAPSLVPPIEAVLRDAEGRPLYSWVSDPPRATLRPGEALHFRTRLATPPEEGRDVAVRFATAERRVEAKR